ncbi:MAG TPA: hypothetical protein V6C65_17795, partial [Allocoleopsis sp.]
KAREREAVLRQMLLDMEEWGITFDELTQFANNNVIHLRDQMIALRKKASVRRTLEDGRRRQKAEANRQTKL